MTTLCIHILNTENSLNTNAIAFKLIAQTSSLKWESDSKFFSAGRFFSILKFSWKQFLFMTIPLNISIMMPAQQHYPASFIFNSSPIYFMSNLRMFFLIFMESYVHSKIFFVYYVSIEVLNLWKRKYAIRALTISLFS